MVASIFFALFIFFLVIMLRLPTLLYWSNPDAGIFAYIGEMILQGKIPFCTLYGELISY